MSVNNKAVSSESVDELRPRVHVHIVYLWSSCCAISVSGLLQTAARGLQLSNLASGMRECVSECA